MGRGKCVKRDKTGKTVRLIGTHVNITKQKDTENELLRYKNRLEDLVETREWDAQGEILFMNNYGLDFFGFKAEYLVGRNVVGTIVAPSDSEGYNLENKMKAVQKNPEAFYSSENENMKKDGGKVWIAWTNKGIYDENGLLLKTLSVGIDRTKQREKEIFCYEIFE